MNEQSNKRASVFSKLTKGLNEVEFDQRRLRHRYQRGVAKNYGLAQKKTPCLMNLGRSLGCSSDRRNIISFVEHAIN